MVAEFYGVDISTIDRYLASHNDELKHNGYVLCKGKSLKSFKLQFAHLIHEASKTTQLGLFNFKAFLNIGMLLTESEKAVALRSMMLDLVIATIHEKREGGRSSSTEGMSVIFLQPSPKKIIERISPRSLANM